MTKYMPDNNLHNKTMVLTGHSQISVAPDTAIIRLGVQTTGENLTQIQADNSKRSQSIIQVLQRMGVSDIKTSQYSIDKVFDFVDGRQIDRGFSVRNILEIRTNNLDAVGNIIDGAVNTGANVVDLISFDITNREYYYQQALNMAMTFPIQREFASTTPIMPGTINVEASVTVDFVY